MVFALHVPRFCQVNGPEETSVVMQRRGSISSLVPDAIHDTHVGTLNSDASFQAAGEVDEDAQVSLHTN